MASHHRNKSRNAMNEKPPPTVVYAISKPSKPVTSSLPLPPPPPPPPGHDRGYKALPRLPTRFSDMSQHHRHQQQQPLARADTIVRSKAPTPYPRLIASTAQATPADIREVLAALGPLLSHIPYAVCGLAAMIAYGYTARTPSHVSIVCPSGCKNMIRTWAASRGMMLQQTSSGDEFGVRASDGKIRLVRIKYVGGSSSNTHNKNDEEGSLCGGGRFRNLGTARAQGIAYDDLHDDDDVSFDVGDTDDSCDQDVIPGKWDAGFGHLGVVTMALGKNPHTIKRKPVANSTPSTTKPASTTETRLLTLPALADQIARAYVNGLQATSRGSAKTAARVERMMQHQHMLAQDMFWLLARMAQQREPSQRLGGVGNDAYSQRHLVNPLFWDVFCAVYPEARAWFSRAGLVVMEEDEGGWI